MNYFQAGQPLQIGDIAVSPFTIPHDAVDPVGFVFQAEGVRMAVATDLGYVTPNVKAQLKKLDLLLLESNHDLEMLRDGPYPWSVKQRVLSRVGHLSNEAAANSLRPNTMARPPTSFWAISLKAIIFQSWPGSLPSARSTVAPACWPTGCCWLRNTSPCYQCVFRSLRVKWDTVSLWKQLSWLAALPERTLFGAALGWDQTHASEASNGYVLLLPPKVRLIRENCT